MDDNYYVYDYEENDKNYDSEDFAYDELLLKLNNENSFISVWENCLIPSLHEALKYIFKLISWNCLCRLGWILVEGSRVQIPYGVHLMSVTCGIFCLYHIIHSSVLYLIGFSFLSYLILYCLDKILNLTNQNNKKYTNLIQNNRIGFIFGGLCIILLIICEILQINTKVWHQIRGIQLIATMKAVSIAFDLNTIKLITLPNFFQYFGYIMCPSTCVLGPWIPFNEYMSIFKGGSKYELKWLFWIFTNSFCAIIFLLISNCILSLINVDSSQWLNAYKDAFSFRNSHYFVSFLSQGTMAAAGFVNTENIYSYNDKSNLFGYIVTKPWKIELPRSLVEVVINWNLPMHRWLKNYVFNVVKPYSIPVAIFITYLISSLLHGLNFQLYAVLLSLGFYTYVEYNLRYKLSIIFNSCILTTKCKKKCKHLYKSNSIKVVLINFIFSILTCLHLAYLGVMFESSTQLQEEGYSIQHTLNKWKSLNFLSLLIMIACYLLNLVI